MQDIEFEKFTEEEKVIYQKMNLIFHRRKKNIFLLGYHRCCVDHGISLSDVPIEDLDASYRHDIVAKFNDDGDSLVYL